MSFRKPRPRRSGHSLEVDGFDKHFSRLYLHHDELLLINNALNELCNGPNKVASWEFHARCGGFREEAVVLLDQTSALLDQIHNRTQHDRSPRRRSSYFDHLR
jgi:hypothetical protein